MRQSVKKQASKMEKTTLGELDVFSQLKDQLKEVVTQPAVDNKEIRQAVEAMAGPLKGIWAQNSDSRMEILVEGSQLAQLTEGAISSVKIKGVVKNMIWNEVVVDEYTKRHALTPE